MKKLLLPICILCTTIIYGQVKFGIQAGVLRSMIKITDDNSDPHFYHHPRFKTGFKFGAFVQIPVNNNFFIDPEVNFVQKGGRYNNQWSDNTYRYAYYYNSTTNNIELPVNLVYKCNIGNGNILAGGGPAIEYCISSKTDDGYAGATNPDYTNLSNPTHAFTTSAHFKNTTKPLSFGANLFAGYEFPFGLRATIQARPDFSNRSKDNSIQYRDFYLGLTAGYMF